MFNAVVIATTFSDYDFSLNPFAVNDMVHVYKPSFYNKKNQTKIGVESLQWI